jgi:hypothetical protein
MEFMFLVLKVNGLDKDSGRKMPIFQIYGKSPHIISRYFLNHYMNFPPKLFEPSRLAKDKTGCLMVFLFSLIQLRFFSP